MRRLFIVALAGLALFNYLSAQETNETAAPAGLAAKTEETKEIEKPDPVEKESKASFWMEQKLRYSTEILAGLAESDFEKIGTNATLMHGLNRVERFVRRGPEGYKDELKLFNMANRAVIRAADEENLEAATLAFNRLTVSCVSCHQRLRSEDDE